MASEPEPEATAPDDASNVFTPASEDVSVVFEEGALGVQLDWDHPPWPEVTGINPDGQAAQHHPRLQRGMHLVAVKGTTLKGMSMEEGGGCFLQRAGLWS
jgi:hypothetical protein